MLPCTKKSPMPISESSPYNGLRGIDSDVDIRGSKVPVIKTFLTEKDIDRLVKEVMMAFSGGNILLQTGRVMSEEEYECKRKAALEDD